MNLNYQQLLPSDFAPESRVWIYQANRIFGLIEALEVEKLLEDFAENWKSHGTPVKGFGTLFFGQFIILMADENATGVSGCSTDSSVRLIKQIEQQFNISLFDRQLLAFLVKEKIQLLPLQQLQYSVENNFIDLDTIYLNNTVGTKQELETKWMIPVKESWLAGRLNKSAGMK
ncbi:MAG: hypothetical protein H7Y31_16955 [Chitinophagaceae bacterium]|nr:hypothetical protein [Chitinophagaceae bacterium]